MCENKFIELELGIVRISFESKSSCKWNIKKLPAISWLWLYGAM